MVMNRDAELRTCRLMIEKLEHQLADHRQHRFGARSETSDQLSLWIENREIGEAMAAPAPLSGDKGKPKRSPLPPHLPRETETLPAGERCSACGGKLKVLGEDVTEELEYVPGRFKVRRIVRGTPCGHAVPAPSARRCIKRRCRPAPSSGGVPAPACSPMSWSANTPTIFPCIARARFTPAPAAGRRHRPVPVDPHRLDRAIGIFAGAARRCHRRACQDRDGSLRRRYPG